MAEFGNIGDLGTVLNDEWLAAILFKYRRELSDFVSVLTSSI